MRDAQPIRRHRKYSTAARLADAQAVTSTGIGSSTAANSPTSRTVSRPTVTALRISLTMYCGSSARLGSLTMPQRASVLT
jgi:hypothetical protein